MTSGQERDKEGAETIAARPDAAFGPEMAARVDLDGLAAMAAADEHHRYECSRDGVLSIAPTGDPDAAVVISRIAVWLLAAGYSAEEVVVDCAIDTGGGRVPNLTVWSKGNPPTSSRFGYASTTGLLLVVEVDSAWSEGSDRLIKMAEYAAAGIRHYWIVRTDDGTVHRYRLDVAHAAYVLTTVQPLDWVLAANPEIP
jgi:Uma2 family endonuclease